MKIRTHWKLWGLLFGIGMCLAFAACTLPPPITETPTLLPGTPLPKSPPQEYPYPIPATPQQNGELPYPPPYEIAYPNQLPEIPNDLMFLDKGRLVLWHHLVNTLEVLDGVDSNKFQTGYVLFYFVHSKSRQVVFVRAEEESRYALILMNIDTKEKWLLWEAAYLPVYPSISPDGQWVVFLQTNLRTWKGCAKDMIALNDQITYSNVCYGTVFAFEITNPENKIEVGKCESKFYKPETIGCLDIQWGKEKGELIWSDGSGIWIGSVEGKSRLLVSTGSREGLYKRKLDEIFRLKTVSPSGRYLLIEMINAKGYALGVLDLETRRVHHIPGQYSVTLPRAIWLNDERIFYLRSQNEYNLPTEGQIWKIVTGEDSSLQLDMNFALPVNEDEITAFPFQINENHLAFVVTNTENFNYQERGLYYLDLSEGKFHRVNGMPPLRDVSIIPYLELVWTSDGSGVIFFDNPLDWLYIPAHESHIFTLNFITYNPCCFTWITP